MRSLPDSTKYLESYAHASSNEITKKLMARLKPRICWTRDYEQFHNITISDSELSSPNCFGHKKRDHYQGFPLRFRILIATHCVSYIWHWGSYGISYWGAKNPHYRAALLANLSPTQKAHLSYELTSPRYYVVQPQEELNGCGLIHELGDILQAIINATEKPQTSEHFILHTQKRLPLANLGMLK